MGYIGQDEDHLESPGTPSCDSLQTSNPMQSSGLALTGISFGSVLLSPPFRGPGGPLRDYGLVRSRCPDQLLASCPRSRGLRGCGLVWSRRPDQLLAGCPRSRGLRGCGLVWSRCPEQLLASCRGGRGRRGYDLVRSRRPEHGVEHAEQLPGHRHDGPLLTAAMHQPSEQGRPFRAVADQPPGGLHQCPPQHRKLHP